MIDYTEVAVVSTFVRLRLLPKISCVNVWTAGGAYSLSGVCGRGRVGAGGVGGVVVVVVVVVGRLNYTTFSRHEGIGNEGAVCTHRHVARKKNMPGHSLRYMYSKAPDVYTKAPGLNIYIHADTSSARNGR